MASSARIDELRKKFDENPRRYFAPLANEYRKAGDLDQAIFICQEYLPQQPGHMSGHIVYGQALYEMRRHQEAQVVFETALSLDPENLIALRHLGDIARQANDNDAARGWYQRVLEADPRNDEIAQIMLSLLSTPAAEAASEPPSSGAPVDASPVVEASHDAASAGDVGHHAEFLIEKSEEDGFRPEAAAASVGAEESSPVDDAPTAAQAEELLDLGDFTIGRSPATDAGAPDQASPRIAGAHEHEFDPAGSASTHEREFDVAGPSAAHAHEFDVAGTAGAHERETEAADQALVGDAPDLADEDGVMSDSEFELLSPAVRHEVPPTPHFGLPTVAEQPAEGFDPHEIPDDESVFEVDHFAIAGVQPMQTVEVGAGLESDTGAPGIPEPDSDWSNDEDLHPDDRNATEPPSRIGGVELASPFEFAAMDAADALAVDGDDDETVQANVDLSQLSSDRRDGTPDDSAFDHPPVVASDDSGVDAGLVADPSSSDAAESAAASAGASDGDAAMGETPAAEAPALAEAFVTETMAELYLRQGHLDSALGIYQRLVEQRPDDDALRGRAQAVEDRVHGKQPAAAEAGAVTPVSVYGGPTIREYLRGLSSLRPASSSSADAVPPENGAIESHADSDLRASSDGGSANGEQAFDAASLAAHPGDPASSVSHESFDDSDGALHGLPARRASNELSLDQVFRGNTPKRTSNEHFSLDRFFSDEASMSEAKPAVDGTASAGEPDDIAQFNAWLNGLKKS